MKKKFTHKDLWRNKLSETPVPDYQDGWEQMQAMLDAIPANVKTGKTVFLSWKKWAAAAILLLLAGAAWWESRPVHITGTNDATVPSLVSQQKKADSLSTAQHVSDNNDPVIKKGFVNNNVTTEIQASSKAVNISSPVQRISLEEKDLPDNSLRQASVFLPALTPVPFQSNEKAMAVSIPENMQPLSGTSASFYSPSSSMATGTIMDQLPGNLIPESTSSGDSKLLFGVRINANSNGSFGHQQTNFNPLMKGSAMDFYPAVYVRKKLSEKWSLQGGLAYASPVNMKDAPAPVARTYAYQRPGIQRSDDQVTFDRLYYIDIPFTFQYHLGNKLSIGSGMQLSILQKVIGEKQRLDYDAANVLVMAVPTEPQPRNISGSTGVNESLRSTDIRWVMGINYGLGIHWEALAQYQRGLTDITRNSAFGNNKNDHTGFFKVSIGYNFR